jgi:hypothetical protein
MMKITPAAAPSSLWTIHTWSCDRPRHVDQRTGEPEGESDLMETVVCLIELSSCLIGHPDIAT